MAKKSRQQEMPVTAEAHEAQEPASASPDDAATPDGEAGDGMRVIIVEDMATIKTRWIERQTEIEETEEKLEELKREHDVDTTLIASAAIDAARGAKTEAVVMLGAKRMKAKRRPEKHGGGVTLVDAPIAKALDI